ncbi:DUF1847 domain-containing protein [Geofilum sp. OHC36d9]|uniref:DUF1847 domain-containing protein n=1 Tax=Geofilum sp. OHC36d9 TaxID=3458413 RepID=UPI004033C51B
MNNLYTKEFCRIMQANYDYTSMRSNRVEEIKNFAKGMNFSRIGIAHCITFSPEAKVLKDYLSQYFEVYTVDCKYGRLTKKEVLGGTENRILCNPAGQADFLNKKDTELNISMGLCVGHDMIFSKTSNAYVTNLFDKDFTNDNNPAQAIADIHNKTY